MRHLATKEQIFNFFTEFSKGVKEPAQVYITGGASSIIKGWRQTSLDIDFIFNPELDHFYRAIPKLKEQLQLNLEIATPYHFIPELPGWRDRSEYIITEGKVTFYHFDFYSQALSKIERDHPNDVIDVQGMMDMKLITKARIWELFEDVKDRFFKYPNINVEELESKLLTLLV